MYTLNHKIYSIMPPLIIMYMEKVNSTMILWNRLQYVNSSIIW